MKTTHTKEIRRNSKINKTMKTTIQVGLKTLTHRCFRPYYYLTNCKLKELYKYKKIELKRTSKFFAEIIFELESVKEEIAIRNHKDFENFNKDWKAYYLIRCKRWEEEEEERLSFAKWRVEKEDMKVKEIEKRITRAKKQRELIINN
tara:strand:+ start:3098 stop:3538 length:441 start_codon:yes stop_codon:yes gene_type:complete